MILILIACYSRSNNFYFILLLMMLFLCTLPVRHEVGILCVFNAITLRVLKVAYAIVWLKPSWHCGPFSKYDRMFKVFTEKIFELLPQKLHGAMDYLTSPGIVIPVFVLLVLIIYYLISLTRLLREANDDLKNQVRQPDQQTDTRKGFENAHFFASSIMSERRKGANCSKAGKQAASPQ